MKRAADKKRRDLQFEQGDFVWLSTVNLQVPAGFTRKLLPKWLGPYEILAVVSPVAYKMQLPARYSRMHDVFHVSLLKPHDGPVKAGREPFFHSEDTVEYEVAAILRHRGTKSRREFLVRWLGYPDHDATWEPEGHLDHAEDILRSYKEENGL